MKQLIKTSVNQKNSAFLFFKSNSSQGASSSSLDIQGLNSAELSQIECNIMEKEMELNMVKHCLDY